MLKFTTVAKFGSYSVQERPSSLQRAHTLTTQIPRHSTLAFRRAVFVTSHSVKHRIVHDTDTCCLLPAVHALCTSSPVPTSPDRHHTVHNACSVFAIRSAPNSCGGGSPTPTPTPGFTTLTFRAKFTSAFQRSSSEKLASVGVVLALSLSLRL